MGLLQQAGYKQEAADNAGQYARYAEQKVGEACRGIPGSQLVRCFSEARIESELEKRQYEHDQADLVAQRKAALWTSIMGIAALLGMGLSVVGVVLVWITFRATREGNEIQKRIGEAQTKAYISVIEARGLLSDGNVPQFGFTIKNSGQSPAIKMRLRIEASFHRVMKPDDLHFTAECKLSGIYSVPATDTLTVPLHAVERPPPEFFTPGYVQCFLLLECQWEDVFRARTTEKGIFAFLIQDDWPEGPFEILTYHAHLAQFENERVRREAKGEWKDEKA